MPESFDGYRGRVLGYLGERDPMEVQRSTPARLDRLIKGRTRRALGRRPAPGKWSVIEILAHLADAELAIGFRLRSIIASSGARLPWWDQDLWARECRYARSDPRRSVATFRALRESNLALLRSLPRRTWTQRFGVHDVRGKQTIADFVAMEAAHDLNHLLQIERLLKTRPRSRSGRAGVTTVRPPACP